MPRRGGPAIVDPDATKQLYRQPKGFDPSQKIEDIKLSPGWYLLQGCEVKAGSEQETEGGLFRVIGKDEKTHNTSQVIAKSAEGCERVRVGDYVAMPAYTTEHSDKMAIPWIRFLGDEESLWLLHEDNIIVSVPPWKGKK